MEERVRKTSEYALCKVLQLSGQSGLEQQGLQPIIGRVFLLVKKQLRSYQLGAVLV